MTATPADVALYTNDGVVVTSPTDLAISAAIKGSHIDARDTGEREIEMFFDNPAHAQSILDERFSYLSRVNPFHVGIEVEEAIDLGGSIPIAPTVPSFTVVDGDRVIVARCRAYAQDMGTDRFSIEVME